MDGLSSEARAHRRLPGPAEARAIRLAAGVGQKRLADELGVDRVTVARWERGARRPRGALLVRYLEVLEVLQRETRL
jgi:transcriptional regulator with XRE-family HTH domain